jgi:uncharacterized protein (TIGR02145 family)
MRKSLLIIFFVANLSISFAQNVGIGTTNPDASAKLEVKSNNSGFLPPRMTYAERNAIVNPATGLIVYCTDCANGEMQFYNGTDWVQMMVNTASVPFVIPTYIGKWRYQFIRDTFYNWRAFFQNGGQLQLDSIRVVDYRTSNGYFQFNTNNTYTWQTTDSTVYNGSFTTATNTGYAYGTTIKCLGISTIPAPNDTTRFYIYNLSYPNMTIQRDLLFSLVSNNDTVIIDRYYELLKYDVDTTTTSVTIPSISIGTQTWSTKNLDVAKYRNGDPIPQTTDATQWANLTTGAWCWYNNDSATYGATYGRLYNWYAVNDPRGLAPQGWRIPTEGDWNRLVKFIDSGADTTCQYCSQSSIAGGAMKSTTGWNSPNTGATNSSGFAVLPGGTRGVDGTFYDVGINGVSWSSVEFDNSRAWYRGFYYSHPNVIKYYDWKANGFSVRVVRD